MLRLPWYKPILPPDINKYTSNYIVSLIHQYSYVTEMRNYYKRTLQLLYLNSKRGQ